MNRRDGADYDYAFERAKIPQLYAQNARMSQWCGSDLVLTPSRREQVLAQAGDSVSWQGILYFLVGGAVVLVWEESLLAVCRV
jgi:hypothetical protein